MENDWQVSIPWVMGLIGTRSVSKQIPGIHEIMAQNRLRIQSGMLAVQALETCGVIVWTVRPTRCWKRTSRIWALACC
jgi:cytochrome bd-type quinol oxidase subunit 1